MIEIAEMQPQPSINVTGKRTSKHTNYNAVGKDTGGKHRLSFVCWYLGNSWERDRESYVGDPCFHCRRPSRQEARSHKPSPGRVSATLSNPKAELFSATGKSGKWPTD